MRDARAMAALAFALSCAGCEGKPVANPYFPLDAGRSWSYAMAAGPGAEPMPLTITSAGSVDLDGKRVAREDVDLGGQSVSYFVRVDDRGVYRYATQASGSAKPTLESSRDYALVYPIEVGKTWQSETKPSFLPFDTAVPIESTVISTSETVTVPAGKFSNCVKIRRIGSAAVPAAPGRGAGGIAITEDVWYARGVGMVKSVVDEVVNSVPGYQRVTVTTALQEFTA